MRVTLCSRNAHKARELEALLPGWSIETLDDLLALAERGVAEIGELQVEAVSVALP